MIAPSSRRWLLFALAATLAFRLWLSAVAPITADEAYFILWGRAPAPGFYDHPPMVGWLLAPLTAIAEAPWLLRLPAVLVPALAALGAWLALRRWLGGDEETANLAALAVLLVPMNVWNVLVTTDTPLVLFSVASLCVYRDVPPEIVGFVGNCVGALAVETVCNREPVDPVLLYKFITALLK